MTNGDKIQEIFPTGKVVYTNSIVEIGFKPKGTSWVIWCDKNWWNSEYEKDIEHLIDTVKNHPMPYHDEERQEDFKWKYPQEE